MAAAAAGRRSKRKSKRMTLACSFLSNISLDGNISEDASNAFKTERSAKKRTLDAETESLDLHFSQKRTLLKSISEPSTSDDIDEVNIIPIDINAKVSHQRRSVSDIVSERKQQERSVVIPMSVSLSGESNDSSSVSESIRRSKSRISCFTGNSFRHKRRATDKR